jgi:hypothetical protein
MKEKAGIRGWGLGVSKEDHALFDWVERPAPKALTAGLWCGLWRGQETSHSRACVLRLFRLPLSRLFSSVFRSPALTGTQ